MLRSLRQRFRADFAVDLGSSNTLVALPGRGIAIDEPTVVALRDGTRDILGRGMAVGRLARQMLGRTPEGIAAVRPVRGGAVVDFELCEALVRYYLRKADSRRIGRQPSTLLTTPHEATSVEKRTLATAAERAGGGTARLLSSAFAAAIGAGLPINEPTASMICDIGGGTTEIAVFSLGEIVSGTTLRNGGDDWTAAIIEHARLAYALKIGPQTAEQLKLDLGSASGLSQERSREIGGLDGISRSPRKAVMTSEDVREALNSSLKTLVATLRRALEACPPELVADLAERGLTLSGGSARLENLAPFLESELGMPCRVADRPEHAAADGALICLENPRVWDYCLETGV